jgi:hypothetical protein
MPFEALKAAGLIIALLITSTLTQASEPRSHKAKAAFQRLYHCPKTDKPRGACPGYIIDHVIPLCAGGADDPLNMQWQTLSEAKAKDREEARQCAALRRGD